MARGLAETVLGEIRPRGVSPKVAGTMPQGGVSKRPARGGGVGLYARLWGAGQGGAAVVLKKIHNGGTHSPRELGQQLDYLFTKASWCGGNAVDFDGRRQSLTPDERKEIVTSWTDHWQRNPKNGHTTHLLVSFPPEVSARKARIIAEDWAADMFENPDARGDQWAYVAALHTDRSHPHVHFVVQNRGIDNDKWFYMAKGHAFDLLSMKERLAEIASDHGVALETTSRVERGILTYGAGRAKIEDARREGRAVREVARTGLALATALAEVRVVSAAYRQLAFVAAKTISQDVAYRMAEAAKALDEGRRLVPARGAIVAETNTGAAGSAAPMNWADFQTHVKGWMDRVGGKMRELSAATQVELRPEFNDIVAAAMEVLGDKRRAELVREAPKSALYRSALAAEPPVFDGTAARVSAARVERLREALSREAEAAGLDGAAIAKRIGAGAASALEERDWVMADFVRVASAKGFDLGRETDRSAVAGIVDRFYERADAAVNEVRGVRVGNVADELRRTLGAMVKIEERPGLVRFESDADALTLVEDMKARYGETIIRDLAQGKTDALARDFAAAGERAKIAGAVVSAARDHEPFGLSRKEAEAACERLARQRGEEQGPSRDNDRER
ncbi:MAG TPA: relaxase/mobilization nuclease domain-containing protein [Albidovulum sp.]|uniref:relaxase/mobilization nuclease domain-containing protein n=1 Tax=Albidovulum sp. TaxID=1872424 RepID=UPI002CCA9DC6|nr:relaxase/mobilization nuclease domain-containing protein [Albidovulum sp.]